MNSAKATLAIDVGASKIAGALISEDFKIMHELSNQDGTLFMAWPTQIYC